MIADGKTGLALNLEGKGKGGGGLTSCTRLTERLGLLRTSCEEGSD